MLFLFGAFGIFLVSSTPFANAIFFSYGITFHFLPLEFLFWYLFTTTFFSLLRFFFPVSFHYVSLYRYNSFFGISLLYFFLFLLRSFFFPLFFGILVLPSFITEITLSGIFWNLFFFEIVRNPLSLSLSFSLSLDFKISHKIQFMSRSHSPYVKIFPQFY